MPPLWRSRGGTGRFHFLGQLLRARSLHARAMPQVLLQVQRQDGKVESDPGDYICAGAFAPDSGRHRRSGLSGYLLRPGAMMQRITREQSRKYAFDWEDEALLRVKFGESFEIETYDASTGYFQSEKNKAIPAVRPGFDRNRPQANDRRGHVWLGARTQAASEV